MSGGAVGPESLHGYAMRRSTGCDIRQGSDGDTERGPAALPCPVMTANTRKFEMKLICSIGQIVSTSGEDFEVQEKSPPNGASIFRMRRVHLA